MAQALPDGAAKAPQRGVAQPAWGGGVVMRYPGTGEERRWVVVVIVVGVPEVVHFCHLIFLVLSSSKVNA